MEKRDWGKVFVFDFKKWWVRGEPIFTTCASAGTYVNVLPVCKVFYPTKNYGTKRGLTIHFGWGIWEILIFFKEK